MLPVPFLIFVAMVNAVKTIRELSSNIEEYISPTLIRKMIIRLKSRIIQ